MFVTMRRKQQQLVSMFLVQIILLIVQEQHQQQPPHVAFVVDAFTSGAGPCLPGIDALGGAHNSTLDGRVIKTSTLAESLVDVTIGDVKVPMDTTYRILEKTQHMIKVTGPSMKGLFIRLETEEVGYPTDGVLLGGAGTRLATSCTAPIVGVNHQNANPKNEMIAIIQFPRRSLKPIIFDVSVVFLLNDVQSVQSYGRFFVEVGSCDCGRGFLIQYIRRFLRQCNNVCI